MLFNSFEFLIFFPLVFFLYHSLSTKWRCPLLLTASYFFYSRAGADYLLLLAALTALTFFFGIAIGSKPQEKRKKLLTICIVITFLPLILFKYAGFADESLSYILGWFHVDYTAHALNFIIPVGLSFYTFQAIGYVVDVARGRIEPERNLFRYALYVSFFPQLVAGPIERSWRLLPQFRRKHDFSYERAVSGFQIILWGLFKKVVIADKLALTVDKVFTDPSSFSSWGLVTAAIFFSFQIYCDFSGYSDMAIGTAHMLGYDLMDNFNRPYLSKSIGDFWRRWHISLYSWFRDYIYIPLGGSANGKLSTAINTMIVFTISGLWHGANYTFVMWGLLHGAAVCLSRIFAPARKKMVSLTKIDSMPHLHTFLRALFTFCLVTILWIFFRANSVDDAFTIIARIFTEPWNFSFRPVGGDLPTALIGILLLFEIWMRNEPPTHFFSTKLRPAFGWVLCTVILCATILLGEFVNQQFIYFVF